MHINYMQAEQATRHVPFLFPSCNSISTLASKPCRFILASSGPMHLVYCPSVTSIIGRWAVKITF